MCRTCAPPPSRPVAASSIWGAIEDRLPVHADVDFSPAFFEQTATGGEAEIDAVVLRQLLRLLWWLAYVPEDLVQRHLAEGRLKRVLEDWCPSYSGYHLYYASRRSSPAFALLVEALRCPP